ncbi:type II toxin-antitoxin system RelE/ParE family toxin [Reyranella sp. CPCC 100927]|nr:type II toxin-antitoxin system RelE/ParE family toxin [Reyranella sp. CPCC 100927]
MAQSARCIRKAYSPENKMRVEWLSVAARNHTSQLVVSSTPFVIVYRIEGKVIIILRLLHGAQQWPPAS